MRRDSASRSSCRPASSTVEPSDTRWATAAARTASVPVGGTGAAEAVVAVPAPSAERAPPPRGSAVGTVG